MDECKEFEIRCNGHLVETMEIGDFSHTLAAMDAAMQYCNEGIVELYEVTHSYELVMRFEPNDDQFNISLMQ